MLINDVDIMIEQYDNLQTTVQIMSKPPAHSNGGLIYLVFGKSPCGSAG